MTFPPFPLKWGFAAAAAKSLQSCLTLFDRIDYTHQAPPSLEFSGQEHWSGLPFPSPVHVKVKLLSRVRLLVTPWTAAYQAPPSMGLSRQEHWSGVPLPSPEDPLASYFPSAMNGVSSYSGDVKKGKSRDFPGGPVVKNLPWNAGDMGLIPSWGTKILHAMEQLNPQPQLERHALQKKIPHDTT